MPPSPLTSHCLDPAMESDIIRQRMEERYGPFKPPVGGGEGIRSLKKAKQKLPLDYLPPFAIPKKGYTYQPPVFYCGYPSNEDDLLSYAEKHGLVKHFTDEEELDSDDEEEESESDDEDDDVDYGETIKSVFEHIISNAEITSFKLRLIPIQPLPIPGGEPDDEYTAIISIFSNYIRIGGEKEFPTGEDLQKLEDYMKEHLKNTPSDRPRWYLSYYFGTWEMRDPTL